MEKKKPREKKDFYADEIISSFRSEGNSSINKSHLC